MKRIIRNTFFCVSLLLAGSACEEDATLVNPDISHEKSTISEENIASVGNLNSATYPGSMFVHIPIGFPFGFEEITLGAEDEVYFQLAKPLDKDLILNVSVDEKYRTDQEYRDTYSFNVGWKTYLLQTNGYPPHVPIDDYVKVNDDIVGTVTIKAGQLKSTKVKVAFMISQTMNQEMDYILPIVAVDAKTGETYGRLDYIVQTIAKTNPADKPFKQIAYVNTEVMSPLIALQFTVRAENYGDGTIELPGALLFDIVNVRTAMLKSLNGRASLVYTTDMEYVLKNHQKYIQPLRASGIKVCLTVKGGGTGLGFNNLSDEQIVDFVSQLKIAVDMYELDGVSLWDEGAGYGKEGMPPMNDTSFAKFIKALKESMPNRLVTLMDTPETTSSLREAKAGIAAGDYLDYAWSNFDDCFRPYVEGATLQPIAGLKMEKYASVSISFTEEGIMKLDQEFGDLSEGIVGVNDRLFACGDIMYSDYGTEAIVKNTLMLIPILFAVKTDWMIDYSIYASGTVNGYYGYKKDW